MTTYKQRIKPRIATTDLVGYCHRFAQSFFGAPVKYASAWEAWQNTKYRHPVTEEPPKGVAVLLWYSHVGTYQGVRKNWGHVTPCIAGVAIYSSPASGGKGQLLLGDTSDVERIFNAKYVGWSEDINGLRVAEPITKTSKPKTGQEEDEDMEPRYIADSKKSTQGTVYQLTSNGRKRAIPSAEWRAIRALETASGNPLSIGLVTAADLKKIPNA